MSKVKAPLSVQIRVALSGLKVVFKNPRYIVFALVSGFIFSGIISSLLKIDIIVLFLFELPLPLIERLRVVWDLFIDVYVSYPLREAFGVLLISYLFGVVLALMTFILRRRSKSQKIPGKSSGIGVAFGAIAGGCAACGTSLLAPFLSAIGITTTASALQFGFALNLIGAIIMLFSIFSLAQVAQTVSQQINH